MTLLGEIGGLKDILVFVLKPCVVFIVGDQLTYHLLSKLFMTNNPNESSGHFTDSDGDA